MDEIQQYLEQHREAFENDLCDLLRIPSISADSRHRDDMRQAANWVFGQFDSMGLTVEMAETPGHPIVYAESPAVEGAPTVLVYGHYFLVVALDKVLELPRLLIDQVLPIAQCAQESAHRSLVRSYLLELQFNGAQPPECLVHVGAEDVLPTLHRRQVFPHPRVLSILLGIFVIGTPHSVLQLAEPLLVNLHHRVL